MSFYSDLQATAAKLIRDKGQALTLVRGGVSGYGTGVADQSGGADVAVYGVVLDYPVKDVDGTKVLRGDKKVLIEASEGVSAPSTKDTLQINGVSHAVLDAKSLAPAGTVVIHTLQVRAGG